MRSLATAGAATGRAGTQLGWLRRYEYFASPILPGDVEPIWHAAPPDPCWPPYRRRFVSAKLGLAGGVGTAHGSGAMHRADTELQQEGLIRATVVASVGSARGRSRRTAAPISAPFSGRRSRPRRYPRWGTHAAIAPCAIRSASVSGIGPAILSSSHSPARRGGSRSHSQRRARRSRIAVQDNTPHSAGTAQERCPLNCPRTRWHGPGSEQTRGDQKTPKPQAISHFSGYGATQRDGRKRISRPVPSTARPPIPLKIRILSMLAARQE
jgi:hypothetical protein